MSRSYSRFIEDGEGLVIERHSGIGPLKYNPYHDEKGRFAPGAGGALIDKIKTDGGFTFRILGGTTPTSGYALSIYKGREAIFDAKTISPRDVAKYAHDNYDALRQGDHYIGGWLNPADGKVYLDVSVVKQSKAEEQALAREHQ